MAYIDTKYLFNCETCKHHMSGKCDTWCDIGESYRPDITKIPIADVVEVKHGYWVFDDADEYGVTYKCSRCDGSILVHNKHSHKPKYCHCGAKMDGGKME